MRSTHTPRGTVPPAHMSPGHARSPRWMLPDVVNEQAVRILLECILVKIKNGNLGNTIFISNVTKKNTDLDLLLQ